MRLVWIMIVVLGGLLAGAVFTRVEQSPPKIKTRVTQVFVGEEATLDVVGSLVTGSDRAGIGFFDASGSVRASTLRANLFGIALEKRSNPDIGDDVLFVGNETNVSVGLGLEPAPALDELDLQ